MTAEEESRVTDRPQKHSNLNVDELSLELIERGSGDRVYERLLTRFKFYLALGAAVAVIIGGILTWTAYRAIEQFRDEVNLARKAVQRTVIEFTDATIPEHRRRMSRFVALESGVPFRERCAKELSGEGIRMTYDAVFKRPLSAEELENIKRESARSNICSPGRLESILRNSTVQSQIVVPYKQVYDREPDPYARTYWGVRFLHGYTSSGGRA